jgi:hypothetical protein
MLLNMRVTDISVAFVNNTCSGGAWIKIGVGGGGVVCKCMLIEHPQNCQYTNLPCLLSTDELVLDVKGYESSSYC